MNDPGARRRHQIFLGGRLCVATLLLGGSLVLSRDPFGTFTKDAMLAIIAATFAMSLAVAIVLPRAERFFDALAGIQLAWDLASVTGLAYLFGGAASAFTFTYGVVILAAALVVGPRATQVTTAGALLSYTVMGLSLANGWIAPPPDHPELAYDLPPDQLALALLRNIVGFVVVGLLAGSLSDRLRRTGGQLEEATASAAGFARLNEDILRSMSSGVVTTDLEGRIQVINPAGAAMLGAEVASLAATDVASYLPIDPKERNVERGEGTATRVNRTTFAVGFSASPLTEASGALLGSLVVFQDLTELNTLREQAERAERLAALGRLAAGLAHEIRNPLESISGSVEMVREAAELGDEDRHLLSLVLGEVDRLDDLVTTMLDVGRPRPPEPASIELAVLANEVANVAAADGQARVVVESEDGVRVWADPAQTRQVIWNLVKNARQFSPPEQEVRVQIRRDEAGWGCVSVSDHGPGIAPEDREHVFDMFFTKRRHGVGLGLALVRQIVEAHGGEISVDSELGRGTTFTVHLPGDAGTERPVIV